MALQQEKSEEKKQVVPLTVNEIESVVKNSPGPSSENMTWRHPLMDGRTVIDVRIEIPDGDYHITSLAEVVRRVALKQGLSQPCVHVWQSRRDSEWGINLSGQRFARVDELEHVAQSKVEAMEREELQSRDRLLQIKQRHPHWFEENQSGDQSEDESEDKANG